jgi:hypothetical protein
MSKKLDETGMAAAGGGPIGPMDGSHITPPKDEDLKEMLRRNPDITMEDVRAFRVDLDFKTLTEFRIAKRIKNYIRMADVIREEITRRVIREKISRILQQKNGKFFVNEIVRRNKKTGKYVLYAPNIGEKSKPTKVAEFPTKLAAKQAELREFPPLDPEALSRLRGQIEKLLQDPKQRLPDPILKESVSRELFERAIVSTIICRDVGNYLMNEDLFKQEVPEGDEYLRKINQISRHAVESDPEFSQITKEYEDNARKALQNRVESLKGALPGCTIAAGEPKTHKNKKIYIPFKITVDKTGEEVGGLNFYNDGKKIAFAAEPKGKAALKGCSRQKDIITVLNPLNEEQEDPALAQSYEKMTGRTKEVYEFIDNFLSKLSKLGMTMLKRLLNKKYNPLAKGNKKMEAEPQAPQQDMQQGAPPPGAPPPGGQAQ